jgi:hypothetical protein
LGLQSHKKSFNSEGVGFWPVLIWHGMTRNGNRQ